MAGFKDKSPGIQEFLDVQAFQTFGITVSDAQEKGQCIMCKHEALSRCTTEAGRREYQISGLCEVCFDEICSGA
jgi:hypothetical protein